MKRWIKGMRDAFFDSLFEVAKKNKDLVLVTSDTGAICHDDFRKYLPDQYINVGIAEQNMIGVAAGLAMTGKKVYCYAIVPFATMRCIEQIKVDVCCMTLPVTVVGIGCGFDYSTLGPTHHGTEDISIMRALPDLEIYSPADSKVASALAEFSYHNTRPKYIRLDRTGIPIIYENFEPDITKGAEKISDGSDLLIISTGRMLERALEIRDELAKSGRSAAVMDIIRIQPLESKEILKIADSYEKIVTLEEHFLSGGLGSAVLELLNDNARSKNVLRLGVDNCFCRVYGQRAHLQEDSGLDLKTLTEKIKTWLS